MLTGLQGRDLVSDSLLWGTKRASSFLGVLTCRSIFVPNSEIKSVFFLYYFFWFIEVPCWVVRRCESKRGGTEEEQRRNKGGPPPPDQRVQHVTPTSIKGRSFTDCKWAFSCISMRSPDAEVALNPLQSTSPGRIVALQPQ